MLIRNHRLHDDCQTWVRLSTTFRYPPNLNLFRLANSVIEDMAALCSHCVDFGPEDQLITCDVLDGGQCSPCKERAAIRRQIKQLKAQHDAIGTAMNAVHDPFIHKLPPEIGSRILHLSLPTLNNGEHQQKATPGPASDIWARPLKLGSVCRKWRQLVWATPHLWTILYIGIKPSMTQSMAESLPGLLHEWLGRTGALPLTVHFFHKDWDLGLPEDDPEDDPPRDTKTRKNALEVATGLAIDILNLHSGRWRNLHLTAGADIIKRFSSSTEPKQLVCLELAATPVKALLPMPEFMTESKLNVTHLKLSRFPLTLINVRWDNITHATLSEVTIRKGLDLLRQAPSLEYYCLSTCARRDIGFINSVLHPRLRSLHLSTSYTEGVLNKINLPSLEEWTPNTSGERHSIAAMLSFVQRSGCSIKVLNLDNLSTLYEVENLLQKLPSLERLQLCFWLTEGDEEAVMDDILLRIFDSDSDLTPEPFLPHLQFLECKMGDPVPPFSWHYIPMLYRNGLRRSFALKAFASKSHINDETAAQLLQLADEGVDLQIIDQSKGGDFLENFRNRMHEQEV